jgi:hypothetical protein
MAIIGKPLTILVFGLFALLAPTLQSSFHLDAADVKTAATFSDSIAKNSKRLLEQGKQIFRYETFGDEHFWGEKLQLHQAIAGSANGGVGAGVSPKAALGLGLKVDMEALPPALVEQIKKGQVDLDDPATTLALLQLNAVVGVMAKFESGKIKSMGITCALCHSTVDDAFAPGIGKRLDGWPNRDLNSGAIIASSPSLKPFTDLLQLPDSTVRTVLRSWGPGKFDAELILDGKAFRPDGKTAATILPPAYGLAGVNLHTYTGWGGVTQWNAFVSNLEMQGLGTYIDSRLDDSVKFPVAARAKLGHKRDAVDMITPKLAALQVYQLNIPAPVSPTSSFDAAMAGRGKLLFDGKAQCASCHVPPLFTEPGFNMHKAEEIGIDDFQAMRSPDEKYRTTPLKGAWSRSKGGYYHDGRFATLKDVVQHYNTVKSLSLSSSEMDDLVEYLKSL